MFKICLGYVRRIVYHKGEWKKAERNSSTKTRKPNISIMAALSITKRLCGCCLIDLATWTYWCLLPQHNTKNLCRYRIYLKHETKSFNWHNRPVFQPRDMCNPKNIPASNRDLFKLPKSSPFPQEVFSDQNDAKSQIHKIKLYAIRKG